MKIKHPVVLYSNDLMALLNCSKPTANRLISKIKRDKGLCGRKRYVTISEFCEETGVSNDIVLEAIKY
jgi:hypothetical protein